VLALSWSFLWLCTGHNVPKQRRDPTLPAWWTAAHDVRLLQAIVEEGRVRPKPAAGATSADQVCPEESAEPTAEADDDSDVDEDAAEAPVKSSDHNGKDKEKEKDVIGINWKKVVSHPSLCKPAQPSSSAMDRLSSAGEWLGILNMCV
jgi:hypothetical protein